jgi:hypothetical protein
LNIPVPWTFLPPSILISMQTTIRTRYHSDVLNLTTYLFGILLFDIPLFIFDPHAPGTILRTPNGHRSF